MADSSVFCAVTAQVAAAGQAGYGAVCLEYSLLLRQAMYLSCKTAKKKTQVGMLHKGFEEHHVLITRCSMWRYFYSGTETLLSDRTVTDSQAIVCTS